MTEKFDAKEAARHPITWFSALLRGLDRGDRRLIDRALVALAALGFHLTIASDSSLPSDAPPRQSKGGGR